MTTLGIVAALPGEARCFPSAPRGMREPFELAPGVLLCVSGIGPKRAYEAAGMLLDLGAEGIVSWGSAGGLDPELDAGSLLLATEVLSESGERYPTDREWRERIERRLAGRVPVNRGAIVESTRVVETPGGKAELFRRTGARAVDMESAALAAAAMERGVAYLAVRAICDPAHSAIPRAARVAVDADGSLRTAALLRELCVRPLDAVALFRLRADFARTCSTLGRVLEASGPALAARS